MKDKEVNSECIQRFRQSLAYFIKVLQETREEDELKILYSNLQYLKIIPTKCIKPLGAYSPKNNSIYIRNWTPSTLFHEFFHIASSIQVEDITCSGFMQSTKKSEIGRGLTEGYTEVLRNRYIYGTEDRANGYWHLIQIAKSLETVIGKKKMENCYFNANLNNLVMEMEKYLSHKECMNLIFYMDFLLKANSHRWILQFHAKKFANTVSQINYLLLKMYLKKIFLEPEKNVISVNYLSLLIKDFTESFVQEIYLLGTHYKTFSGTHVDKALSDVGDDVDIKSLIKSYK